MSLPSNYIGNPYSLNPVRRPPAVITSTVTVPAPVTTTRNPAMAGAVRLAGRGAGEMIRIPIDPRWPDAYGIIATLNRLAAYYARLPEMRAASLSVLPAYVGNNNVEAQISAVVQFVRGRLEYVADPDGAEFVISPLTLLEEIATNRLSHGDCDDHVLLLNSMLGSLGIRAKVVGVKLNSPTRFDHVISSVWNGARWVDIDPCAKGVVTPRYNERLE